jgi:ATP-dependent Clp protease ATP-binding subunit ClpC
MGEAHKHKRVEEVDLLEGTQVETELGVRAFSLEGLLRAERGEARPLGEIEDGLNYSIIGQPEAIEGLMMALNREKLRNPNRPYATAIFLGPTGVGKSETAKELARRLHPKGGGFLKISSEVYRLGHNIAELVGSPPGYVGREQTPIFDSKELKKDKCVVLFDEVEKGSQEYWDLLLTIMEDGEVPMPGKGRNASFKNAIVILTSNLGSAEMSALLETQKLGFQSKSTSQVSRKQIENSATRALEKHFRPEFINRLSHRIVFNYLDDEKLGLVLDRYVEKQNEIYQEQAGISLTLTPELRDAIIASCDDRKKYGARPITRKYENLVENMLAEYVNSGGIKSGNQVFAVLSDETPEDAPLIDRIEMRYKKDESLPARHASKAIVKNSTKEKKEVNVTNSQLAIGVAAVATIAGGLFLDYLGSRRRARRAF